MKTALVAIAAAGLVAAWDFSGQLKCIAPCLTDAMPKVGCKLEDKACACEGDTQKKLLDNAAPCISKCQPDEAQQAESAVLAACAEITDLLHRETKDPSASAGFSFHSVAGSQTLSQTGPGIGSRAAAGTGPVECKKDSKCKSGFSCGYKAEGHACAKKTGRCKNELDCGIPIRFDNRCFKGYCYDFRGNKAYGEKCSAHVIEECGQKLSCDRTHGICKRDGGKCAATDECVSNQKCVDGICLKSDGRAEGQPCRAAVNCVGALTCFENKCAQLRQPGQTCSGSHQCVAGSECPNGACGPVSKKASKCTNESDCQSNFRCFEGGVCCKTNSSYNSDCRKNGRAAA